VWDRLKTDLKIVDEVTSAASLAVACGYGRCSLVERHQLCFEKIVASLAPKEKAKAVR
jgi:hypothetical protein